MSQLKFFCHTEILSRNFVRLVVESLLYIPYAYAYSSPSIEDGSARGNGIKKFEARKGRMLSR